MAKRQPKKARRKPARKKTLKQQIQKAFDEGKALVIVEDRPCSVEVSRMNNGTFTYSLKAYVSDEDEMFKVVPKINKVRKAIEKLF